MINEELTESGEGLVRKLKDLKQAGRVKQQREQHIATQAAEKPKSKPRKSATKLRNPTSKGSVRRLMLRRLRSSSTDGIVLVSSHDPADIESIKLDSGQIARQLAP